VTICVCCKLENEVCDGFRDLDFLLEGERDDLRRDRERDLDFLLGGDFDSRRDISIDDKCLCFFLGGGKGIVVAFLGK